MGILPGVANSQATVLEPSDPVPVEMLLQLVDAVCAPPHVGVAAAASPHRKSTTGLKRREAKPASAQLHTH